MSLCRAIDAGCINRASFRLTIDGTRIDFVTGGLTVDAACIELASNAGISICADRTIDVACIDVAGAACAD